MFKFTLTLVTIFALLVVTMTAPVSAQPQAKSGPNDRSAETANTNRSPDLKKVFDDETQKFKKDSATFDPVKVEQQKNKQQAQKKGWSKKQTTFIVLFAVGVAVLVFLVAKYGKNCIETTPPNCNIASDENCYCERYEEDNQARGVR